MKELKSIKNLEINREKFDKMRKNPLPFAVLCSIVINGALYAHSGDIPFVQGVEKQYPYYKEEFDSYGNKTYDEFYTEKAKNLDGKLYYYSKWNKVSDGVYERVMETYNIPLSSYDEVHELVNKLIPNNNDNLKKDNISDLLGEPSLTKKEYKKEIPEDDSESYFKAAILNLNDSTYRTVKQSAEQNENGTLRYLLFGFFLPAIAYGNCVTLNHNKEALFGDDKYDDEMSQEKSYEKK